MKKKEEQTPKAGECDHDWVKLLPDDETGGIIKCPRCPKCSFLEPGDMKEFIRRKAAGEKIVIVDK